MPRKSAETHLTVVHQAEAAAIQRVARVRPPAGMPDVVAREFLTIVNSCVADHFRQSDVPLLARYVELIAIAQGPDLSLSDHLKVCKTMALLATRLRLAPSTRGHHRSTARQQMAHGRAWENNLDD